MTMREYSTYRRPKNVIEWKRTNGQFVAILEPLDAFETRSIKELKREGPETILVGTLRENGQQDWYALAYSRMDLEFDEARTMARAALDRWRAGDGDQ